MGAFTGVAFAARCWRGRIRPAASGQAIVETALVLPLILLALLGGLQFVYLFYAKVATITAAWQGARTYAVYADTSLAMSRVQQEIQGAGLPLSFEGQGTFDPATDVALQTDSGTGTVTVAVTYHTPSFAPLVGTLFGGAPFGPLIPVRAALTAHLEPQS